MVLPNGQMEKLEICHKESALAKLKKFYKHLRLIGIIQYFN